MKLFNSHIYYISFIKDDERKEVVDIAKKNNLKIMYLDLFREDEKKDLHRICIDDNYLGGILSCMCGHYAVSVLRDKKYRCFKSVKELKDYIEIANSRKEHYFIKEKDIVNYNSYLKGLSYIDLENEYYMVKNLIALIDSFYIEIKDYIDNMIIKPIEADILKGDVNFDMIKEKLDRMVELRKRIEDFLDIDIYIDNKKYEKSDARTNEEMLSYLVEKHTHFHTNYGLIKTIYNNLDNIFNIFNYKLWAEGKASYKNGTYDNLRKIGFEVLPDDIIGNKDDYISVLNKLLYFLKDKLYSENALIYNEKGESL